MTSEGGQEGGSYNKIDVLMFRTVQSFVHEVSLSSVLSGSPSGNSCSTWSCSWLKLPRLRTAEACRSVTRILTRLILLSWPVCVADVSCVRPALAGDTQIQRWPPLTLTGGCSHCGAGGGGNQHYGFSSSPVLTLTLTLSGS